MASTMATAHCSATSRRYFSATLSTHPALKTISLREYELLSFLSAVSWSGCCSALATHTGTKAWTTAVFAAAPAAFSEVPPVTQPPHVNRRPELDPFRH